MTTQETAEDEALDSTAIVTVTFRMEGDDGRALMQELDEVFRRYRVNPVVVLREAGSSMSIFDILMAHKRHYGGEIVQLFFALRGMGIHTAAELAACPVKDLQDNPEIGAAGLERLRQALEMQHMHLADG